MRNFVKKSEQNQRKQLKKFNSHGILKIYAKKALDFSLWLHYNLNVATKKRGELHRGYS